jgi:hypothetical protein
MKRISAALVTGGLSLFLLGAAPVDHVLQPDAIEQLSKKASTPEEHAKAAKQLRLRAEALDAKAAEHEENARNLRKTTNPMSVKWPAMVQNGWKRESQLAIQARRAAQECYARAAKHVNLAVEERLAAGK